MMLVVFVSKETGCSACVGCFGRDAATQLQSLGLMCWNAEFTALQKNDVVRRGN